ncbi:MAG: hypothetical protein ACJAS4_000306 [Bacteriovoracaceae bacterium]|jgi:hypothetical protein
MKLHLTRSIGLCLTALSLFTSCKEEEFYEKENLETLADQYELDREQILNTKKNCEDVTARNSMLTKLVTIQFPSAIECNFNEGGVEASDLNSEGNGPRLNQAIRARVRQDFTVEVSTEETLCDMNFIFPNQQMKYDDEIFLLLNDYVIISSQNYSESDKHPNGLLTNEWGLQEFSWYGQNSLYGSFYDWNYTDQYCLGVSAEDPEYAQKCAIPQTETVGEMKLDIPNEEIIKIGVLSRSYENDDLKKEFNFSFVTTGDNDNGDCEHAAYSFDVELKYY